MSLKNNETLDVDITNGYFLRIRKDKNEAAIERFDIIPKYEKDIYPVIKIIDCLNDEIKTKLDYGSIINSKKQLVGMLNDSLFKGKMFGIMYENIKDMKIFDTRLKFIANTYKDVFYKLTAKGEIENFLKVYKIIFMEYIKYSLATQEYKAEAYDLYNFMSSIEGGKKLEIHERIKEKFRKAFKDGKGIIDNEDEYFFAIGQLVYFLFSKSRETSKNHNLVNRILNFRNIDQIKLEIQKLFKRYNHDIKMQNKKFNMLYEMVLGYVPENTKIDYDRLLGGYLSNCLIYEKNEEEKEN